MMAQLERDRTGMSPERTTGRGGWWGVAFVITLLVAAAMVSLPTSAKSGSQISAFYRAHAGVIFLRLPPMELRAKVAQLRDLLDHAWEIEDRSIRSNPASPARSG